MSNVKITIGSTASEDSKGRFETIAHGQLTEKNGTYYVRYDETADTGMEGTKTLLKWTDDTLIIIRHGNYEHKQELRQGFVSHTMYTTPYFSMPLVAETRALDISGKDNQWRFAAVYKVTLNDEPQGQITLDILIEEEEPRGN